jgi:hypothetical protein
MNTEGDVGPDQDGITVSGIKAVCCHLTGLRSRLDGLRRMGIASQLQTFASRHKWAMVYERQNCEFHASLQSVKLLGSESYSLLAVLLRPLVLG